jgi:cell division protein FtsN
MKPQGYIPPSASHSAHEGADLNVPLVVRIVVILAATLVVLVLLVVFLFHYFNHEYPARTSEATPVITAADLPPQPRLQIDPKRELEEVRANEDKHLDHYAWVDQQKGVARVPIDRAMALWVKNYSPTAPVTNAAAAPTELQMRQQKAKGDSNAP